MKLIDLNRDGGIGANALFITLGQVRILIDCGLHPKKAGRAALPDFGPISGEDLDLIVITHCHLDHIGALPVLMREQPDTPAVMSRPSRALLERMLHNSASIMRRQREEGTLREPALFGHEEIDRIAPRFVGLGFGQVKRFHGHRDEVELVLHPAGHIAGAAGVEIRHAGRRYFVTGDVLFDPQRTVAAAEFPNGRFDVLITETTRGDTRRRTGRTRSTESARLIETINTVIGRGGSFLIPVFALGRMQEVFTVLREARKARQLVEAPVFAAGLGLDLADYLDQISKTTDLVNFSRSVLRDLRVKPGPRNLVPGREPAAKGIYVLSSGMLVENTPSYAMAASLLPHEKNAIGYVGYCDPDTPGGKMLAALPGDPFLFAALDFQTQVKAEVMRFELSGHAERDELVDYALSTEPDTIVLTHGDPSARAWFMETFAKKGPGIQVIDPVPLQSYEF